MKSFVYKYFDRKPLRELKRTITPGWNPKNLQHHLGMIDVPGDAKRILEIGCGIGRILKGLAVDNERELVGIDASGDMVREGRKYCGKFPNISIHRAQGNLADYGEFDFVFSWLVFQHIPSHEAVLGYVGEAAGVLVEGGKCRFQLLTNDERPGNELWTWHDPESLVEKLEANGCEASTSVLTDRWTVVDGFKKA